MALLWHPDKHSHRDSNARVRSDRMMRILNEAKDILQDPPRKLLYDKGWNFKEINMLEREG